MDKEWLKRLEDWSYRSMPIEMTIRCPHCGWAHTEVDYGGSLTPRDGLRLSLADHFDAAHPDKPIPGERFSGDPAW